MKSKLYERIKCSDGYTVSIQAGAGKYCEPRDDIGPYTEVELGYPSMPDPMLNGYAEDPLTPTGTVYPYVPASLARDLIVKHGGAVSGQAPAGVTLLWATCESDKECDTTHMKRSETYTKISDTFLELATPYCRTTM